MPANVAHGSALVSYPPCVGQLVAIVFASRTRSLPSARVYLSD
jgi:hypothetical protein